MTYEERRLATIPMAHIAAPSAAITPPKMASGYQAPSRISVKKAAPNATSTYRITSATTTPSVAKSPDRNAEFMVASIAVLA